jgi:hypothetical protein
VELGPVDVLLESDAFVSDDADESLDFDSVDFDSPDELSPPSFLPDLAGSLLRWAFLP